MEWQYDRLVYEHFCFPLSVIILPNAAFYIYIYIYIWSRDSVVDIATRYGLDGPGIESRCERDFPHPSRPALRPIQPPIQWIPGLSRG
jgi:hypothetical protein